jgi:hypothetical protein
MIFWSFFQKFLVEVQYPSTKTTLLLNGAVCFNEFKYATHSLGLLIFPTDSHILDKWGTSQALFHILLRVASTRQKYCAI